MRERFIVKVLSKGEIGVYDTTRGSYPAQTAELRTIGIERLGWLTDMAEAEDVAERLNALDLGLPTSKGKKAPKVQAEDDLAAVGAALIEDQSVA